MALPSEFSGAEDYFEACMTFLNNYRDLYWKSNTDVLTDNLDFHVQLTDCDATASGDSLNFVSNTFFMELDKISPYYESFLSDESELSTLPLRMSRKKAHEVVHLTEEIKNVCRAAACETVVDVGAGLGYIDYQIYLETGFNVLGLEGQKSLYVNAKEHQKKHHTNSLQKIKYIRHVVSENSDTNINSYLKDKFPNDKGFCFMGLHACGDLTVSAIKLFLKMQDCRALIVTPCCYHKMAIDTDNISTFKNFPLSETLKRIYQKYNAHTFLNVPFLRMAAQPAHIRSEDIQDRVFYLIARSLLKVYARKYDCVLKKKRRKPARFPNKDFAKYAEEATTKGFRLIPTMDLDNRELKEEIKEIPFDLTKLQSMWDEIPDTTFTNAALYISYQNHLTPVFENFILYDRLVYLKEQGIESCHYKKVVNEQISPKCLSLFAIKA